ncbi:HutD family protein [Paracoccus seriniphilus]|uniref:HutD protein n=1 Tax=Paracoccus seriniphilus TaxID=184748 RepID=A0A239PUQ5_9RHOB|nr:HutD family protein [Paracoccus seriniphilus]WCR15411.1 HutD family protein [Paracoccus seriniphilus]SNT73900.1 hypothetical protein SAMN05444959_10680 [Paracoccus seriniphilus]
MQILKHSELVETPWKNGGGITRHIARGMGATKAAWTISRADVAGDGPFSDFSGMMRVLTVVSDGVMALESPVGTLRAEPWKPLHFDGGWQIHSRLLDGPLTDLNLMFDPQFCEGEVLTRQGPLARQISRPAPGILAFHILSGAPRINGKELIRGDSAIFGDADAEIRLDRDDALLELRVSYLDHSEAIRLCIAER